MIGAGHGGQHPVRSVHSRRWRELEAHHLGLDFGYTHTDWPLAYVRWDLADTLAAIRLDGGLAAGRVRATDLDVDVSLGEGPEISAPGRELLGWLTGRGGPAYDQWPTPPPWPMPAPDWRPS